MSRKQDIYKEILFWALPSVRNALSRFRRISPLMVLSPRVQRALRSEYEVAQFVHNIHVSITDEGFTDHDIWFLNHQARAFCEQNDAEGCILYSLFCYYIQELFKDVPEHLSDKLMWSGPRGDYSWACPSTGFELGL